MSYATNPNDGIRTYFEDDGGSGPPVLFYPGYADPIEFARQSELARALGGEFRLIFADHRGQGESDKPYTADAYALPNRVADAVSVLDALAIERAHFIGFSWGARLGFAVGEYAPSRVATLVLCGNQPYAWDFDSPLAQGVAKAVEAGRSDGIEAMIKAWETAIGAPFPEPIHTWALENDAQALVAAWDSIRSEGAVSQDLASWRVPCLIYTGAADDMRVAAERAANEIPNAKFLALGERDHFSATDAGNEVLPHVLELFRKNPP